MYNVPLGRLKAVFFLGLIIGLILEYIMNRFDIGRTFFPMVFSCFFVLGIGFFIIFPAMFGSENEMMELPHEVSSAIIGGTSTAVPQTVSTIPIVPATASTQIKRVTTATPVQYYTRNYQWTFDNYRYTYTLKIPTSLYAYYKEQPHNRNYVKYAISEQDRKALDRITTTFQNKADSKTEAAYNLIAFIQSLPYSKDYISTGYDEYPRYPIETLVDGTGDCEDTAILTAALLKEMGYDVVLVSPPRHMAVGITCDGCKGSPFVYNHKNYYYLETTGNNWKVGQIPEKYQNTKVKIYPI
ncbi:transglutaminase-like domain-containing protein [Methanoregula sp.]|uniref:transglutaminase domain-containing protein n=1 Tax=Methanoregula sp. TaxID=2052170 RepID=UPI0026075C51|nr:transglutaminase-like domain-containing protein [Methanoregula sp.]MDD5142385.1 transglutaminase-like domain-containing protein [Methanoregula sp.]